METIGLIYVLIFMVGGGVGRVDSKPKGCRSGLVNLGLPYTRSGSQVGPRDGEKQSLSWLRAQLTSASIRTPWNNHNPTANSNINNKRITILTLLKHLLCAKYFKHLIILTLGQSHVDAGVCICVCTPSFSCVWLFATPWTVARQAPLSMEFSRKEYWSGLPFPSPGDLPSPGTEPNLSCLLRFFTTARPGKQSPAVGVFIPDLQVRELRLREVV